MILREDVRRQLDLEDEARGLGAVRYRQSRPLPWRTPEEDPSVDEEANLPPGQQLVRMTVEPTAALLMEKLERAAAGKAGRDYSTLTWLEMARPEEVAYLTARVALNAAASKASFQSTTRAIADHIIDHVRMEDFRKQNRVGYAGFQKANKRRSTASKQREAAIRKLLRDENSDVVTNLTAVSVSERTRLGGMALETLIEATGLFSVERGTTRTGSEGYIIRPTETVEAWLEQQHARCELLDPMLMPMVVRPKRWRSPFVGGYLTKVPGKRLVKNANADYQNQLFGTDLSLVYEAVNHIQETPWRINRRVLSVMREVWDSGGSIAGLPPRNDRQIPERLADLDEDAIKSWKRDAAMIHEENSLMRARRLVMQQKLWLAEKFSEEPAIWFPHSMDFRGRIYPIPATGIHPQADDPGKALLEFAHGMPLGPTGGYWLAVHIANLFGVDKVSFKERVEWTYAHSAELIDSALQPLDGQRFWTEADSPWMALAAIFDFVEFLQKGEGHVSHTPIPLDGSNSGLQHFSAMLRDPVGASSVNLTPSSDPQDIYVSVGRRVEDILATDDGEFAAAWRGKVTRPITKRPTMTFVYSATRFGMQDMIFQTLRELDADNAARGLPPHLGGADNYQAALYLSHIMFEAISDVVSAAAGAMAWLREVAKVAMKSNNPIQWTTPDGLPILQSYREVFGKRIQVHWQGRRINLTLAYEGSRLNSRAQANGIAPNFVHSLDAAHLRAVARGAKAAGIGYLAVIHDSFGTHAARTDELVTILKETFVDQYEPDLLLRFRDEIASQLPPELAEELPPMPPKGSLDLNEVRAASYIFA